MLRLKSEKAKVMNTHPPISYVILSYNIENFIAEAMKSALEQDYQGPIELVVVDDCSSDNTYQVILDTAQQYSGPHRIVTHKNEVNLRATDSMYKGVQLASHPIIIRGDGDDIALSSRVRYMMHLLAQHPHAAAITHCFKDFQSGSPLPTLQVPPIDDLKYITFGIDDFADTAKANKVSWWGNTLLMKREVFDNFGPFSASIGLLEDTMFFQRIMLLGSIINITNAQLLYYRRHGAADCSAGVTPKTPCDYMRLQKSHRAYYQRFVDAFHFILQDLDNAVSHLPQEDQQARAPQIASLRAFLIDRCATRATGAKWPNLPMAEKYRILKKESGSVSLLGFLTIFPDWVMAYCFFFPRMIVRAILGRK